MIRAALERLAPFAKEQGAPLDEAAIERLVAYLGLLEVWNRKIRLTGDRDVETLAAKHCADSIVVASEVPPRGLVLDVGSGAGLPGLVIACVRPDVRITLVESRQKACSFLDAAAARIPLPGARVINARVEDVARDPGEAGAYGVVVSRGVDLPPFLPAIRCLVAPHGVLLMMLSLGQAAPEEALRRAAFVAAGERLYSLPSGERRRLARYAPA